VNEVSPDDPGGAGCPFSAPGAAATAATGAPAGAPPHQVSRRHLLKWGALGGGLAAAGSGLLSFSPASASPSANPPGTDGPAYPDGASRVTMPRAEQSSFEREHQLAVLSEPTRATTLVAFDVIAANRSELRELLQTLTSRMRLLYWGGLPQNDGPSVPPDDNGILGPLVPSSSVAFVLGMGASLFDDRYGLAPARPPGLIPMESFPNDNLDPAQCQGDLSVQICADDIDTVLHALRDITKHARGAMQPRWRVDGFHSAPRPSGTPRNLMGFKDGTANPDTAQTSAMEDLVWAQPGGAAPAWTVGGTYQVVRVIRMFVEFWDRTLLDRQENIIGRRKATGFPLGAEGEFATFDYTTDPQGLITPLTAHIRLANPRTNSSAPSRILRRGYNYDRGIDVNGNLDQGLIFTCYQQDLLAQFITVQGRLINEPLADFISPIGGGYFFCPPGLGGNTSAYFGEGLLQDTAAT
jgi:deferrochelatase/peroxidase EfeB